MGDEVVQRVFQEEQNPAVNVEVVQDPAKISDGGASASGSVVKSGGRSGGGTAVVDDGEVKSNEKVMKDGRITQVGKYNDILKSGSDFMELVGAHKEALSALDSIEAGAAAVGKDSSTRKYAKNSLQKKEFPTDQNDKTDNAMGTNGQLIQEEEREKGRVDENHLHDFSE
ncbi:ABC transporter C family member 3 [Forsythia ovata]|uniref:ABC transporter C family member 3 n=1 Tax=Forsythia ovata TaxID=205694 RepID=A0ABD1T634_9LAMI